MDLVITNAAIITGNGYTHHRTGSLGIAGGTIAAVWPHEASLNASAAAAYLDAAGATVLPGVINAHAHGCVHGPAMPSGSQAHSAQAVRYARNRHLLGGTTTIVNVCGLAMPSEVDLLPEHRHPLPIYVATAHTPSSISAAQAVDGQGLTNIHLQMTVDEALQLGAVALGEGGGGQTLGGGAQDYLFIPKAVFRATGIRIEPSHARMLKEALLGRTLENMTARPNHAFRDICRQIARVDTSIQDAIALAISNTVMAPVQFAREGLEELAAASERTGFPAILHTATSTIANVIALASRYQGSSLIAAHCNHPSFTPQEAVSAACRLRELGVTIDVSTLDTISTRWRNTPDNLDALIDARLADTLSTDFAGGHWDGILDAIHRMISRKQLPAPAAVALSTGNVARRFPLFADRGLIEVGKRADIVIADSKNLGRVRDVIIGGKIVVQDGALVASPQR